MTWGSDYRWRIVALVYIYSMDIPFILDLFGPGYSCSLVILDKAKIHMYKELSDLVGQTGAFF